MTNEYFADAIIGISIIGPTVRIDFGSHAQAGEWTAPKDESFKESRPPITKRYRIVMPLDGFMQAFGAQEQLVQQLVQNGIVKRG